MIRRLMSKPLAVISIVWIVTLIALSILAPVIAPYGPDEQDIANAWQGPSAEHWLGTGQLGLDVLSRLLYGGQVTLMSTAISVGVYALVGIPLGLLAGYRGGFFDALIMRASEISFAIPGAVIVLVVLAVRPNDETAAMIALGLLGAPSLARVVRAATINVREELYIRAAKVSGLRDTTILTSHVLPSVMSTVIVHVALFATAAIGLETGLGFLGVGTKQVTWGQLVAEASANLGTQPWLLVPSGFVIITFILAFGLLGDGLRDAAAEAYSGIPRAKKRKRGATDAVAAQSAASEAQAVVAAPYEPQVTEALLAVSNLSVEFEVRGEYRRVIDDINFELARQEKLGIVGESGSGKSVSITAMIGLLQGTGRAISGTLTFAGKSYDLTNPASVAALRGKRIGLIGQDPISSLDPSFTVRSQLAEVIRSSTKLRGAAVSRRVTELLEAVRLPDPDRVARSYPHQLSGGMAQRIGIALALAAEPDVILADEPTTALDVTVQAEILDLLRSLDAAVIMVTHDWGVLADLCTRAIVMYAGEVVETGAVAELITNPTHPYTAGLLRSNPHFATRGELLPAIVGQVPAPGNRPIGCRFADRCPLATDACNDAPIALVSREDGPGQTRCIRQGDVVALGEQIGARP